MSRATHGGLITIKYGDADFPKEWGQHEFVKCRTIKKQGDSEWINMHSTNSVLDEGAKDGVRVDLNGDAAVSATVARMLIAWGLTRDQLDGAGNPIPKEGGGFVQEDISLPGNSEDELEKRLEILHEMHELDVLYIFNRIMAATPKGPLATKTQQSNSAPSASVPS